MHIYVIRWLNIYSFLRRVVLNVRKAYSTIPNIGMNVDQATVNNLIIPFIVPRPLRTHISVYSLCSKLVKHAHYSVMGLK